MPIKFTEFRKDGWPICPSCGEDEVYSLLWKSGERPPLEEFLASPLSCYNCGPLTKGSPPIIMNVENLKVYEVSLHVHDQSAFGGGSLQILGN